MRNEHLPDLSLFLDILQTLEAIGAPYMVIGAFAGAVYGITRITYDIDVVVDLDEEHIEALVAVYPPHATTLTRFRCAIPFVWALCSTS